MRMVKVATGKPYEVIIEKGFLDYVGDACADLFNKTRKVLIVTDDNVAAKYLNRLGKAFEKANFEVHAEVFTPGEGSKNVYQYASILNRAASLGFCRDDAFVGLGGGVVGDLTGFAAATYMRGIRYVQVPTTLLAAIDSSVGGKTGIDIEEGKNLAGAFCQPEAVFFDPDVLDTLPEKEWKNGLGEGLKYAVLAGGRIKEIMEEGSVKENLCEFCHLCVKYKADIVAKDEKEGGLRQLLNLGHTVGHAEEKLSKYTIPHGEAVAAGIAKIAASGYMSGELPFSEFEKIMYLIKKNGLQEEIRYSTKDIAEAAENDKKAHGSGLNVVTIHAIGDCRIKRMTFEEFGEYIR